MFDETRTVGRATPGSLVFESDRLELIIHVIPGAHDDALTWRTDTLDIWLLNPGGRPNMFRGGVIPYDARIIAR